MHFFAFFHHALHARPDPRHSNLELSTVPSGRGASSWPVQCIAACKALKTDAVFQSLRLRLQGVKKNAIHQMSNAIIRAALNRDLDLLVIGKNEHWKSEVEMGRKMNRLFCALPHAQLIQALQYKAHMHGIAVLCTEESYTSKTSFVHGEELRAFSKEGNHQPSAAAPLAQRKKRELILTPNEHGIEVMHADINGAFNITRKVCPWLKFDAQKTSLKYRIWFVVDSKLRLRKSPRQPDLYTKEVASLGFIVKQAFKIDWYLKYC